MTLKVRANEDGTYKDIEHGSTWTLTPGDAFANSEIECTECGIPIAPSDDAFVCLDGGDAAHSGCVEVVE